MDLVAAAARTGARRTGRAAPSPSRSTTCRSPASARWSPSVAPPLAIGTVELEDGEAIKGYLCEGFAAARARDITDFGGWVAFRDHLQRRLGLLTSS